MGCLLLAESIIMMISSSRVFIGGNSFSGTIENIA